MPVPPGLLDDDAAVRAKAIAELRFVHASPDAPAVDIYAEGVSGALITALAYTETSEYLDLAAGDYNIQIRAHGACAEAGRGHAYGAQHAGHLRDPVAGLARGRVVRRPAHDPLHRGQRQH